MWAYTKQAQLLFNKEDGKDSFELYDKAIAIKDNHVGCILNYALNLSEIGQSQNSLQILEKSLTLFEKAHNTGYKNAFIQGQHALIINKIATIKQSEPIALKAFDKYEEALKLDPTHLDNLGNYSNALVEHFNFNKDIQLLEQAIQNHNIALKINPDHSLHLDHLVSRLLMLYHVKPSEELLEKAFKSIQSALVHKPNETYNLACYYSLSHNFELTKINLLHAEKHNTLPINSYEHLMKDMDLENIRNEPWFIELLERIKAKEESLNKVS